MEQRKKPTQAERKQMRPKSRSRRTGHQNLQDKPVAGKKGARGQSAGLASKVAGKGIVGKKVERKKSGAAKQASGKEKQAARHKRPSRTE